MTSLADVAAQLRRVAEQLPIPQIGEAADHAEAAATILAGAFAGTNQPDFVEAIGTFAQAHSEALSLLQQFIALRDAILTLADNLTGQDSSASAQDPPTTSPGKDRYPTGSAGTLIDQPYSAPNSRIPVVGIAQPTGSPPFEFAPQGGKWTQLAKQRLADLNAPPWAREVDYHIELQVAAWMIAAGHQVVVLTINREPCGERFGKGCHQVLQGFPPRGYRLVIHGTRGGDSDYTYIYEGRSEQ